MASHNDLGKEGESIAKQHLEKEGYVIAECNYTFQKGEIDIIAFRDDYIVFVEVKTRQSKELLSPQKSVTRRKQKIIIRTAHQYIIENEIENEARFDIIGIVLNAHTKEIDHIRGAFYPMI